MLVLPPPARGRVGEGVRIGKAIDVGGSPSKFGVTRVVDFSARLESYHRLVMPGLDPGIHAFLSICQDVDGRDEPGHDDVERMLPRSHPSISGVSLHAAFEQKM